MDFLKLFYRVVGIDLSGGKAGVPKQFLDGHKACALVEKMRRESVPQHMGAFLL